MSTPTTAAPGAPGAQRPLDLGSTPRVSFGTLVKVELRKSYDTRAGLWLLIVTAGLTALAMVITLIVTAVQDVPISFGTFLATTAYTSSFLLPVLGIMLVTSEWNQRTAMTTFTLEPNRSRVLLAKLVAGLLLALTVAVVAVIAAVLSNLVYGLVTGDVSWSTSSVSLPGFLIVQAIAMLIGFAFATLLLNTAAAIVVYFAYSFVLPALFAVGAGLLGWFADLRPWIDFNDAQSPLFDWSLHGEQWGHLVVAGLIWLVMPFGLGLWRVLRAELK